jgi:hypothetical protein
VKRCLSLTLFLGLPLFATNAQAQWVESFELEKPTAKVPANEVSAFPTVTTDASALQLFEPDTAFPETMGQSVDTAEEMQLSQTFNRNLFVNRPWSYIGAGVNFGLDGDTALGSSDNSFGIISKIALNANLSLRPGVRFSERSAFMIPITYDIPLAGADPFEPATFHPFVGGGVMFTVDDDETNNNDSDNNIGPMLTGGVDVRLDDMWVINSTLNVGFMSDDTEIGILFGVGYIFSGS